MPRLRILHVLEAVGHGTGRHLLDLCRRLPGVGHRVALPVRPSGRGESDPGRTAQRLVALGVPVHRVPLRGHPLHPDLLRAVARVAALARRTGADVVHGHAGIGGAVGRLAGRLAHRGVVYTPNGLRSGLVARVGDRLLAPLTDRLVAVSPSEARLAERRRLARPGRIRVVPNGIDPDAVPAESDRDLRASLGLEPSTPLVGFVGRLARQKAPEVLVEAVPWLPASVHAALIGGGPRRRALERRIAARGLTDRVHLLGHVPGAARLLPQLDVLALPSRWEGGPYVPLEAFRAGVPVVTTDVVGARDVVAGGRTGVLVPPDDPEAFGAALGRVLGDDELRRRLTAAAETALRRRFDVRSMAARTGAVYREVADVTAR